jgi:hypothetical protein
MWARQQVLVQMQVEVSPAVVAAVAATGAQGQPVAKGSL